MRRCKHVDTIVKWRGGALRLARSFLTYTRSGPSASVSGRLRFAAERYSCYSCYFVNPLRSVLLLYISMPLMRRLLCYLRLCWRRPLPALVVVAAPLGPHAHTGSNHVCSYTLSACVSGPIEHLCTSLTSNVRTRDSLSVVSRSGHCCFYTSCTIPTCAIWMVLLLYDIDVRVMSVRTFTFSCLSTHGRQTSDRSCTSSWS